VEHVVVDLDAERDDVKRTLVVANQTVASRELLDALKRKASEGPRRFIVIAPQSEGEEGGQEDPHDRLAKTLEELEGAGLHAVGQVEHHDPYTAIQNALQFYAPDDIVISTFPETRSGWLRQGLVDRVERAARRPVEHVVVDLDAERDDTKRTLVVANQTVASPELLEALKKKAGEGPRRFIVIAPQSEGEEGGGEDPHDRLAKTLEELEGAGLHAIGQVEHHDPYTAIQNALQFYAPDDIVISTFPETRSGWLRGDLVGRVEASTGKKVEHVVSE